MNAIVEVDERGTIQLPSAMLAVLKPRTRYVLELQGETLLLHPVTEPPFWQSATPQERAEAVRHWAVRERPATPPLPEFALRRDHMYD
ncbi:hypothetical protein [Candidatus Viridilinea mediisalina]|uniref:SpoVT-AbrB domain-containing protein n=1 Tax=Candidatus Viridilinea mediisalina TaxID=2024553 RepID=A0A2A6RCV0_9CHLR|nr:hypothetical protein [Candidatus Viridilinea mediisalina]PDV98484.1 hypothetical protein CJ255_21935 [Candidatus Viridilinea mediisalina]